MWPKSIDDMTEEELINLITEMYAKIDNGECIGCEHISATITNSACIKCCQENLSK
jgi:hypothetical protein